MNDEGEVNISRLKHKSVPSFPKPPGFGNPLKEKNMYKQMNKKEIQPPSPHLEGFFLLYADPAFINPQSLFERCSISPNFAPNIRVTRTPGDQRELIHFAFPLVKILVRIVLTF